jgi:hypothetical protein
MNLATYGQAVIATIKTVKRLDAAFSSWWEPRQQDIDTDPLMAYFRDIRDGIAHEGPPATTSRAVIGANGPVNMGALMRELNRNAPPGNPNVFLGDSLGGSGWIVTLPTGETGKVYFALPENVDVQVTFEVPNPPTQHDGQTITDTSVANLGFLYLGTLRRLVDEFGIKFA